MLQQTRVEAVRGYYERFLRALPDISSLASADEDLCLKLWEGLGYYSRVRNLRKGAAMIMEHFGGQMPKDPVSLRRIPGIGPYTAAAIGSIAFGQDLVALDGNLLRIYSRLAAYSEDIGKPKAKKEAESYFRKAFFSGSGSQSPASRNVPGDINQALMDLGAGICLPNTQPRCGSCPLRELCAAEKAGDPLAYPFRAEKKTRRAEELTVLLIRCRDGIVIRKRPSKGLLAGLYEYPNLPGSLSSEEAVQASAALGYPALRIRPLPDAKHIFTHVEWHMRAYEILTDEFETGTEHGGAFGADINEIESRFALPSAFAAYTDLIYSHSSSVFPVIS